MVIHGNPRYICHRWSIWAVFNSFKRSEFVCSCWVCTCPERSAAKNQKPVKISEVCRQRHLELVWKFQDDRWCWKINEHRHVSGFLSFNSLCLYLPLHQVQCWPGIAINWSTSHHRCFNTKMLIDDLDDLLPHNAVNLHISVASHTDLLRPCSYKII